MSRCDTKISGHGGILEALSENNVKRVDTVLATALKAGKSVREILNCVLDAAKDLYHARGFTDKDYDHARLIRHVGGHKALWIASKAFGLPALSTTHAESCTPTVLPSAKRPTRVKILMNMRTMFPPETNSAPSRCGFSLQADDVAIRPAMTYVAATDLGYGGCREHLDGIDVRTSSLANILHLQKALHGDSPAAHYGSVATVAGLAAYRKTNYRLLSVMISASCKAETAVDFAEILENLLEAWWDKEKGPADSYRDIWTFCCDGASTFRGACFTKLMSTTFDKSRPALGNLLGQLKGFNQQCSPRAVVHCPDPKHLFKRE